MKKSAPHPPSSRRAFLRAGAGTAGALVIGAKAADAQAPSAPSTAAPTAAGAAPVITKNAVQQRKRARVERAFRLRVERAVHVKQQDPAEHETNGDEARYPNRLGSFTKGLAHDALGDVDAKAFKALTDAMDSDPGDFEALTTAGGLRLVNPQAALCFNLDGADSVQYPLAPPPAFSSAEMAAQACELYWQALTRDVPFSTYERDPLIQRAAAELSKLSGYEGPRQRGAVTPSTIFRGTTRGDSIGPYVSQFLLKEAPFGASRLHQHVATARPHFDYMVRYDEWLAVQNGAPNPPRHGAGYLYIRNARDLAAYMQFDFTYQAFLTACLILFGFEGTYNAQTAYKGSPFDKGNPYRRSPSQAGFITFGVGHVLDLVARVAASALKACWYQKWCLHRNLRPEELGGRVHNHRIAAARHPLHPDILDSAALEEVFKKHGTYLLPQGYPEGSPLHPAYPSGHATIAGACATVLKAFFEESFPIEDPVVASDDGLRLLKYEGQELTVGAELDKLATNVGMGRNWAGIHWRSDLSGGLLLGEQVALSVLADLKSCHHESGGGFSVTRFDGRRATL
jgi:membrane-associated phospholipid phosphatase